MSSSTDTRPARIMLLPGDGVGPEVINEAHKVLRAAAERFGHRFELCQGLIGGCAIDRTADPLPANTLSLCRQCDAVLLGAVGGPQWDDPLAAVRPEQGLLRIRSELGLFANLRPVRVYPALANNVPLKPEIVANVDLVVVRELTGGLYFGKRGREPVEGGEHAYDTMSYTTPEIERIARMAAMLARSRGGKLTSVDKANVLESSRLWRATVTRVIADEFPDVELEHVLVDSAAMHLIQRPRRFDVIVTENMFGDILTDEASVLAGSMGLLPSASLGDGGPGLYEPIHGSAPDIAGRNIANPIGMILSAAMMCRMSLGWIDAADCITAAVEHVLRTGRRTADIVSAGQTPIGTAEMGTRIADFVAIMDVAAKRSRETECVRT
ncbi:MAG: 3-isopropylmalate dehydrogenase [Phycisphaerae bacterium]|nr:3-isopropylmalate dehydrogenase [Phycisphaerae bacterium]